MNFAKQLLLIELDYTIWANRVLLDACAALTDEELSRNLGASHSSLIRTLRHIYDAERSWTHNLTSNSIPSLAEIEAAGASDQSRSDPTFESLQKPWFEVWDDARQWIAPLSEEDLARELSFRQRDGTDLQLPRWQVLLHMVNHSTLHRGQIISMLRALGKQPPSVDLLTYYRLGASSYQERSEPGKLSA